MAAAALPSVEADSFTYLIQEYEPFTFAMGTWAALAAASYDLPHTALFSTELLRDFFRRRGIGVFRDGAAAGDARLALVPERHHRRRAAARGRARGPQPAPAAVLRPPRGARGPQHVRARAAGAGPGAGHRSVRGLGAARDRHGGDGRRIALGGGASIELLPRSAQADYADVLRAHDVGLALMYTPHPSLVPIEMASAGMLCVTNTFENKTAEALAAISPNLVAAEAGIDAIAQALCEAAAGAGDTARRLEGAGVAWSREWADRSPMSCSTGCWRPAPGARTRRRRAGAPCRGGPGARGAGPPRPGRPGAAAGPHAGGCAATPTAAWPSASGGSSW